MYLTTVVFVNTTSVIWIPCDLCTASQYMHVLAKKPVNEAAEMGRCASCPHVCCSSESPGRNWDGESHLGPILSHLSIGTAEIRRVWLWHVALVKAIYPDGKLSSLVWCFYLVRKKTVWRPHGLKAVTGHHSKWLFALPSPKPACKVSRLLWGNHGGEENSMSREKLRS